MATGLFSTTKLTSQVHAAHERARSRRKNIEAHHQARRDTKAALVSEFAERLSIHGDVQKASKDLGISWPYGRTIFARIKRELGWQAS
jgi:predicted outer membrane protein